MRCAAQYYEYVPDDMIVRYLAHEIEHRANTVEHTARHEPPDCFHRKRIKQRLHYRHGKPAHDKIADRADYTKTVVEKYLKHDTGNRQSPDYAEYGPA